MRIPRRKSTRHYVDNKAFYEAIKDYKKQCAEALAAGAEKPRVSEYIGKCIWLITENVARLPKYMNYSFIDEMKSDALENCFMYFDNFNADKYDNPFAYFTQITNYAFLRRITKEEKNRYIIYKSFQESVLHTNDADRMIDGDDNHLITHTMYDNINDYIGRFEQKEAVKKAKRKEKKEGLERFTDEDTDPSGNTIPVTDGD